MLVTKTSSKGFTLAETVIVVLVIAVLAFGGWFVWRKNHTNKESDTPQVSRQQSDHLKEVQTNDQSEGGKYLVIKEWNVRILLPESLRGDVEYGLYYLNNGDQTAYFASKKLAAKATVKECGLVPVNDSNGHGLFGGLVAVTRSASDDQIETIPELTFQASGYWYTLGFENGGACYEGDTGSDQAPFKSVLGPAIKSLQSLNESGNK